MPPQSATHHQRVEPRSLHLSRIYVQPTEECKDFTQRRPNHEVVDEQQQHTPAEVTPPPSPDKANLRHRHRKASRPPPPAAKKHEVKPRLPHHLSTPDEDGDELHPILDPQLGCHHLLSVVILVRWSYNGSLADATPNPLILFFTTIAIFHAGIMLLLLNAQLTSMLLRQPRVWLEVAVMTSVCGGLCDLLSWDTRCFSMVHMWLTGMQLILVDAYRPHRCPVSALHLLYGVFHYGGLSICTLMWIFPDMYIRWLSSMDIVGDNVNMSHVVGFGSLLLTVLFMGNIWHAQEHPNYFSVLGLRVTFTYQQAATSVNGIHEVPTIDIAPGY